MDSIKLISRNSTKTSKSTKRTLTMKRAYKKSKKSLKNFLPEKVTIRKKALPTVSLGIIPPGHISNIKFASEKELNDFVNDEINYGPQIVSIPVPPQRHAFLVDVQPKKIMISDWGGEEYKTLGIAYISGKKNKKYEASFKQYSDLMIKLEEKYKKPIHYYAIDNELYNSANKFSEECGGNGGCSNYIYAWVKKYYPEYR